MSESASAEIVCTKCGQKFSAPGYACSKCQGSLAKVCGNCGFKNSVAKNYCDRCGTPMTLAPAAPPAAAAAPPPEAQPPGTAHIPQTASRGSGAAGPPPKVAPPPPAGGLAIPAARRMDSRGPAPVPEGAYVPPPPTTEASFSRLRRRDALQKLRFWLPILAVAAVGYLAYYDYNKPEKAIPRAAAQYLGALNHLDFPGAYALLSQEARAHCSLEEFRALSDETPWTWSDVQIVRLEPEAAVVKYRLISNGQPPSDDFLILLREDGKWMRPYNWNLLQKIEDAFARKDPDMALLLAQAAVRINPRDPIARGYLCESVYFRNVPAETERECALAISLSRIYPSKLSLKSLYHLRAILGDTYKNSLRKYPEAVAQYDAMLAFPNLAAQDKCKLLLARADTRAAMGVAAEANLDLKEAASLCTSPEDLAYVRRKQDQTRSPK